MVQLGQFFYNEGDDSEKAFYWLQHAAGKGDITAQATIGVMYKTGEGVKEQSIEKALNCLKLAANRGNNYARGHLAELQYKLKLFTEAAQTSKKVYDHYQSNPDDFADLKESEGLAISVFILGRCVIAGRGATQDIPTGEQLIKMTSVADKSVALRLHREWVKGCV